MPNVEYMAGYDWERCATTMPHDVWTTLGPHAQVTHDRLLSRLVALGCALLTPMRARCVQHITRHIVAPPGVAIRGAGIMHPRGEACGAAGGAEAIQINRLTGSIDVPLGEAQPVGKVVGQKL